MLVQFPYIAVCEEIGSITAATAHMHEATVTYSRGVGTPTQVREPKNSRCSINTAIC